MISFHQKGDFSKLTSYLEAVKDAFDVSILDRYGRQGVEALSRATPKDTGRTANSWFYKTTRDGDRVTLSFHNSNIQNGVPIAVILQYGHGTGWGGYVQGRDYINPAIQPIFDKIAQEAWKEVTKS